MGPRPSAGSPDARLPIRSAVGTGKEQTTAAARSRDRAAAARLGTGRQSHLNAGVVRRFARLCPSAELLFVRGVRHFVQADEPAAAAEAILRAGAARPAGLAVRLAPGGEA